MMKETVETKISPRDVELVLGVIGGILGLIGSLSYIEYTIMFYGNEELTLDLLKGLIRIIACVLAIRAAYNVQYKAKHSGITFIICGFTLLTLVKATVPGGIVLFIVGVMCFLRK
jgi:hypothetical protein